MCLSKGSSKVMVNLLKKLTATSTTTENIPINNFACLSFFFKIGSSIRFFYLSFKISLRIRMVKVTIKTTSPTLISCLYLVLNSFQLCIATFFLIKLSIKIVNKTTH